MQDDPGREWKQRAICVALQDARSLAGGAVVGLVASPAINILLNHRYPQWSDWRLWVVGVGCAFLGALVAALVVAPYRQRNAARRAISSLEKEVSRLNEEAADTEAQFRALVRREAEEKAAEAKQQQQESIRTAAAAAQSDLEKRQLFEDELAQAYTRLGKLRSRLVRARDRAPDDRQGFSDPADSSLPDDYELATRRLRLGVERSNAAWANLERHFGGDFGDAPKGWGKEPWDVALEVCDWIETFWPAFIAADDPDAREAARQKGLATLRTAIDRADEVLSPLLTTAYWQAPDAMEQAERVMNEWFASVVHTLDDLYPYNPSHKESWLAI